MITKTKNNENLYKYKTEKAIQLIEKLKVATEYILMCKGSNFVAEIFSYLFVY